ncbi:hypothetical protein TNCV_91441 [Trichonephila clavipes]|nr:hypothetical protein TNCV_91441 [Trichonephila clavipes]
MDVCKCIVHVRQGMSTLNSRRAASPLVKMGSEEERWKALDLLQGVLLQNWGEINPNHTVICMMLKATAKDRRTTSPLLQ